MKILVINCGSSTLKFQVIDADDKVRLAWGLVDGISQDASIAFESAGGERVVEKRQVVDHGEAARLALQWAGSITAVDAVGHRVVHGGDHFVHPTLLDEPVINALDDMGSLAPLHNAPSVAAMRAALEAMPSIPMVAVFDTAFHSTVPQRASEYAIPHRLAEKHHVRRYGFHGLAHQYMMERYAELTSRDLAGTRLITLQLGSGCSAAAVLGGKSVDTSMGFTPLEGLMMGTRSGDLDPSLVGYLARREGVDLQTVENWLNKESGLLGVSGGHSDMRALLEAERQGDARAALAVEMFCYRVKKYIGAYMAALGGADAVIFGGGIGENSSEIRERICEGMEWCGLTLDAERNARASEGRLTGEEAHVQAFMINVDEESIIARETAKLLAWNEESK